MSDQYGIKNRDERDADKAARDAARDADKAARDADKTVRQDEKAADKTVRQDEKAADKTVRQDEKAADKTARQDEKAARKPVKNSLGAGLAEVDAVREAMADRITDDNGPVLHVPTTVEEHTELANKEALEVSEAIAQDDESGDGTEVYHRVIAQDGPINTNERNGFDPFKPDTVSTDAGAVIVR